MRYDYHICFESRRRFSRSCCLNDLTEEQVRRSIVPSRTTLLGLVKHATFVEKVWFDEAITCRSRTEIGIPATPDEPFILDDRDTIASTQRAHHEACEASHRAASTLGLDDLLHGNRRGPLSLRWMYLHMLRELAQHCGHADILREQLISEHRPRHLNSSGTPRSYTDHCPERCEPSRSVSGRGFSRHPALPS